MATITAAINDFYRARRRASLEQIFARLTGKSADLLSYEEVRRQVRANQLIERGLQDVPLDAIVGSVGRYKDFTRTFLPKESISENRWANVKTQNITGQGLPPIELYRIGDAYFVLDGNHRVSVAREMGLPTIQAYVTEVLAKVPITPDMQPDDLIIAEQYADFLEKTELDRLRPEIDLRVTAPGKYPLLLEHIAVHRYFMGVNKSREIGMDEAAAQWYDEVYRPVIDLVRERGMMGEFPERTETDLYIWLAENRAALEESLGWDLTNQEVVDALADESQSVLSQVGDFLFESGSGEAVDSGERLNYRVTDGSATLFQEILVSVGENEASWAALEQAALFAKREGGRLRGLHFTPSFEPHEHDPAVHERFDQILREKGLQGRLADAAGDWAQVMSNRAGWSDLLVLGIQQPPEGTLLTRLTSQWRQVLQYSPRPVLAVPRGPSALEKGLVPYDGSRRSRQALYVGAYLAGRWGIPITLIAVGEPSFQEKNLGEARRYLDKFELSAETVGSKGDVATNILVSLESHGCDFIIMGGYGKNPLRELFIGSTVDQVLRHSWQPVLLCQ